MGEFNKARIIKHTREYLGLSQMFLAENICETETLNRYENGKLDPTDLKYKQIMEKLGISSNRIYISSDLYNMKGYEQEILQLMQKKEYKKIANIIKRKRLEAVEDVLEYQFYRRIEIIIDEEQKRITKAEARDKFIQTLRLSIPEWSIEDILKYRIYTRTEILLINNIAITYSDEKDYSSACRIYDALYEQFRLNISLVDYRPLEKVLINYSNCLGLIGQYDKCLEVCLNGIKWLKDREKENLLYNYLFNIGWVLNECDEGMEDKKKTVSQAYIWLAIQLAEYYAESNEAIEQMKQYYMEQF